MNKQDKGQTIDFLAHNFQANEASFLINFKGLTVHQMQTLRRQVRKGGGMVKVAKARLMKRAVEGIDGAQDFKPFLRDQVGIVFASKNFPVIAKTLHDFSKQNESMQVVAAFLEQRVFDKQAFAVIAQLPPKEVLVAQLCGVLKAPTRNLVGVLHMVLVRLLFVLKQAAEKKAAS